MKKKLAIIACKLVRLIGKPFKRGSSLPGQIALKIDNNILKKIKLPKTVIAVSGSNGKTSTVEMIKEILTCAGYKVAYNYEGSNQIEGITTLILNDANLKGECRSDVILMEADERYARFTFKQIIPTHFVILNLYRDQLTRNGNPEEIFKCLKEAINPNTKLIINSDDPLVTLLSKDHKNVVYFEIDKYLDNDYIGVYDDGKYCPNCKSLMKYDYRHYGSTGNYHCTSCGFNHPNYKYHISKVNLDEGHLIIDDNNKVNLSLKSIYNAYNILASFSLSKELNINNDVIINCLNNYILKNGRVTSFKLGSHKGMFLLSKHENSTSYNQSLTVIKNDHRNKDVLIVVDAISRKYFTSETSWLWDIDFNLLNTANVEKVVLAGQYASDLALRFEYTDIDQNKIIVNSNIEEAINDLRNNGNNFIYALTCFSDMNKILDRVEITK